MSRSSGGTLTFAVGSDAGCVDPQQVGSNDTIYSVRQLVDSLTDQDPETGEIVPWLAESWEVSDDATAFTFTLRDGVTFSDGTPARPPRWSRTTSTRSRTLGALAGLATRLPDRLHGHDGRGRPDRARSLRRRRTCSSCRRTSTHSLGPGLLGQRRAAGEQRCSEGIVGSGPFTLGEYVQNQSIMLTKRAGYDWGSSLLGHRGRGLPRPAGVPDRARGRRAHRQPAVRPGRRDRQRRAGRRGGAAGRRRSSCRPAANPGVVVRRHLQQLAAAVRRPGGAAGDLARRRPAGDRRRGLPDRTLPATSVLSSTTPGYTDVSEPADHRPRAGRRAARRRRLGRGRATASGRRTAPGSTLPILWAPVAGTNQPALELLQQQLGRSASTSS